jgi:hypothetical protein
LSFEEKAVGALLILDDIGFAPTIMEKISETNSTKDENPEALGEFYKELYRIYLKILEYQAWTQNLYSLFGGAMMKKEILITKSLLKIGIFHQNH